MQRSKSFEKALSQAAIARLKSSPATWTEFKNRNRRTWSEWFTTIIVVLSAIWGFAVAFIPMPLWAGIAIGKGGRDVPFMGIMSVFVSSGFVLWHARWLLQELVASRSLAVASQLPIADVEIARFQLRRWRSLVCWMLPVALSHFFGIAVGARLSLTKSLAVIGLGCVEWLILISLSLILVAYFPFVQRTRVMRMVTSITSMSLVVGFAAGFHRWVDLETVLKVALSIVPTGWPLLMVGCGVLGNSHAVFGFLIGVLVLLIWAWLAVRRICGSYVLAEFNLSDNQLAIAVLRTKPSGELAGFEPLIGNDADSMRPSPDEELRLAFGNRFDGAAFELESASEPSLWQRLKSKFFGVSDIEDAQEFNAEQCRELIRQRAFLKVGEDWPRSWLEKSFCNLADDRERMIADVATGGAPGWSRVMVRGIVPMMLVLVIGGLWTGQGRRGQLFLSTLAMSVLPIVLMTALGRTWPAMNWKSKSGQMTSVIGLLPISMSELMKLTVKLGAIRASYLALFLFAMAMLIPHLVRGQWDIVRALIWAAKGTLVVAVLHQWFHVRHLQILRCRSLKWLLFQLIGYVVLFCGALTGVIGLFRAGRSEFKSLVAISIVWFCGWMAQRLMLLTIRRSPYDFITESDKSPFGNQVLETTPELKW